MPLSARFATALLAIAFAASALSCAPLRTTTRAPVFLPPDAQTLPVGASTFLGLSGSETREIFLVNNDLRSARSPHALEDTVPPDALQSEANLTR